MSFPNIPDINPCISITFEEAINLLLTSIALEEVSLSNLLDAEACKIKHVLDNCCCEKNKTEDALAINKSVDDTIKNMIKLQMLLQFKLDNIKDLLPRTTTCSCTTTCSSTTTSSTSTCSTTTKKPCKCSLIGCGIGCITNCNDDLYCQTAELQSNVCSCEINNRYLHYSVKDDYDYNMIAKDINIECPHCHSNKVIILGNAHIKKKSDCCNFISDTGKFILSVFYDEQGKIVFNIRIKPDHKHELKHDSGDVENLDSKLKLIF